MAATAEVPPPGTQTETPAPAMVAAVTTKPEPKPTVPKLTINPPAKPPAAPPVAVAAPAPGPQWWRVSCPNRADMPAKIVKTPAGTEQSHAVAAYREELGIWSLPHPCDVEKMDGPPPQE